MDFKNKIIIGLSITCLVLFLSARFFYEKYKKAIDTNIVVNGELTQAKITIEKLTKDIAGIKHDNIQTAITIKPTTHTETNTIKESSTSVDGTVTNTIIIYVKETLKNTEIILVQDNNGNWWCNEQQIKVIINKTEIGFVFSSALSATYSPSIGLLPAVSIRFLKILPVYIGVTANHKLLGLDVSYQYFKNVSSGVGYGIVSKNGATAAEVYITILSASF